MTPMLLVLTTSEDATANYAAQVFNAAGLEFLRLDTDAATDRLRFSYSRNATLTYSERHLKIDKITNIWLRRPTSFGPIEVEDKTGFSRHAANEWAEAIEGVLGILPVEFWVNHPTKNALASHKIEQLHRARLLGLRVPETLLTQSWEEAAQFWEDSRGRLITKPLSCGYVEAAHPTDDTIIYTSPVPQKPSSDDDSLLQRCPTLFQEHIDKQLDVRITIIDDEDVWVGLRSPHDHVDVRFREMRGVEYCELRPPAAVRNLVLALCRSYHLCYAAVDMCVTDDGEWYFLEINPDGQWAWLDLVGGTNIVDSFVRSFLAPKHGPR